MSGFTSEKLRDKGWDLETGKRIEKPRDCEHKPLAGGHTNNRLMEFDDEVRDLHIPFKDYLGRKAVAYIYSRPDRPTGQEPGVPDFCFAYRGRPIGIEFKLPKKKPRKTQVEFMDAMRDNGWTVAVCYSVHEAAQILVDIDKELGENPGP